MCGIVGYIGHEQAQPILLEGLSRLEYRGYDSAGIAVKVVFGFSIMASCGSRSSRCRPGLPLPARRSRHMMQELRAACGNPPAR